MTDVYSFTYSIPYLFFGIFLIVLSYLELKFENHEKKKRKIRYLCWIFFLFFFGLRGFVAYDWFSYYKVFQGTGNIFNLREASFQNYVGLGDIIEPFFVLYNSIIKTFFNSWTIYVFISSLIDLLVLNYAFKKYSPNYAFSMLLFLSMSIALEFDTMRNIKAVIIFILSFDAIYNRKFLKFCLFIFIGFMFHRSMFLFFPFYFIANIKSPKQFLVIFLIICNVIFFSNIEFANIIIGKYISFVGGSIGEKANYYSINAAGFLQRGFTLGYFSRSITYLLIIVFYSQIIANFKYGQLFINLYLVYFFMTFAFSDFKPLTDRIELLYGISYWILWPYIIYSINKKDMKQVVFVGMTCFCLLKIYKYSNNFMYDYENVLTGTSSYQERVTTHFNHAYKLSEKQ